MAVIISNPGKFFIIPMLHRFVLYRSIFDKILLMGEEMFTHQPRNDAFLAINHLILDSSYPFVF